MTEVPEGLRYLPGFLTEDEERALAEELSRLPYREFQMRGMVAKRTVAHYGWNYGYESWSLTPAPRQPVFLDAVLLAYLTAPGGVRAILEHLALPSRPARWAPAQGPPRARGVEPKHPQ